MDIECMRNLMMPKYEHDNEFVSYVAELLDANLIEDSRAKGIGKQIIDKGVESLSDKQVFVFLKYGLENNYLEYCDHCYQPIPWSEMFVALDDGYCSYCRHILKKED